MTQTKWWILLVALSAGLIGLDIITGPFILFPITFVIPVGLATWYISHRVGIGFALVLVGARFGVVLTFESDAMPLWAAHLNAGIRLVVLIGLSGLVARVDRQRRMLAERIQILEGILPICAFCKKIRRPDGRWEQIEAYISERSAAEFSHSCCEACGREHYGEYLSKPGSQTAESDAAPERGS